MCTLPNLQTCDLKESRQQKHNKKVKAMAIQLSIAEDHIPLCIK